MLPVWRSRRCTQHDHHVRVCDRALSPAQPTSHPNLQLVLRVLHLISIHKYLCALTCPEIGSTQRIYQISIWAYKQSFYPVPKLCKIQILVSSCLSINQQFFKKFLSADAHRSLKISNFHKELSLLSLKVLNCSWGVGRIPPQPSISGGLGHISHFMSNKWT